MQTNVRFLEGIMLKLLPYQDIHFDVNSQYELPIAIEFIKKGVAVEPFVVGSKVLVHAIGGYKYEWGMSETRADIGEEVRIAKRVDNELYIWAIQRLKA